MLYIPLIVNGKAGKNRVTRKYTELFRSTLYSGDICDLRFFPVGSATNTRARPDSGLSQLLRFQVVIRVNCTGTPIGPLGLFFFGSVVKPMRSTTFIKLTLPVS